MALNAAGDLDRQAWNDALCAGALCLDCDDFTVTDLAPETIKAKAREHTRAESHRTRVTIQRVTQYEPGAGTGSADA